MIFTYTVWVFSFRTQIGIITANMKKINIYAHHNLHRTGDEENDFMVNAFCPNHFGFRIRNWDNEKYYFLSIKWFEIVIVIF